MDIKQLKYFICIADLGSMTRASESLNIAQPALTQQIAKLEGDLRTRVFDRGTSGVKLTPAGEVLYRYAKSIILFNQTCAHCHGPDAVTGLSERNLRHLRARYGADMHDVFTSTVMNRRPDKGMPVWGEVLDAKTIDKIYSYLETIQEDAQ